MNLELARRVNLTLSVKRGQIQISTVDQFYVDENKTGYLHLIQFSSRSREEVANALDEMGKNGMKSLVLDLRDNAGGLLSSNRSYSFFFQMIH